MPQKPEKRPKIKIQKWPRR